eukprot:gene6005-9270_t
MIFLDDDIIIQGDIVDAWEYPLQKGKFMGAGCLNWVWSECQREVLADNLTYAEVPYFGYGALGKRAGREKPPPPIPP